MIMNPKTLWINFKRNLVRRSIKKSIMEYDPKVVAAVTVSVSHDFKQPGKDYLSKVIIYNGLDNAYDEPRQQQMMDLLKEKFSKVTFISIYFNRTFLLNPKLADMFKGKTFSRRKIWK
jgi:hypothetical protein